MARQSLRKRSRRNSRRHLVEFNRIQRFLKRLESRVCHAGYSRQLTVDEKRKIQDLLTDSIMLLPTGYDVTAVTKDRLKKDQRTYFHICKILRQAGQRLPPKITKVIVRKAI